MKLKLDWTALELVDGTQGKDFSHLDQIWMSHQACSPGYTLPTPFSLLQQTLVADSAAPRSPTAGTLATFELILLLYMTLGSMVRSAKKGQIPLRRGSCKVV